MSVNANIALNGIIETCGAVTASSIGTALSTSYAQLKAVTDYEWNGLIIDYSSQSAQNHFLTLALGSAGNEFPFIPNLPIGDNGSSYAIANHLHVPIRVPAGVRLSAKITGTITSCDLIVHGLAPGYQGACASGAFLESPNGTTLIEADPGGVANTKGAWIELVSATTYPWNGFFLGSLGDEGSSGDYLCDVAIGAAGSEMIIMPNQRVRKGTSSTTKPNIIGPYYGHIPAGTRIAARCQSTITSSASRKLFISAHGIV